MTNQVVDDILEHYGTKGMRWGIRKDKGHEGEKATTRKISKLDKKYERSLVGVSGYVKMNNAVANRINPRLDVLNGKPKYQGDLTKNPKLHKQYLSEYKKELQKSCEEATADIGSNASGTRRVTLKAVGEGLDTTWEASMEDLKHADGANVRITPKFDSTGHIIGQTLSPIGTVEQGENMVEEFLAHFGVKGMRWGVRTSRGGTPASTRRKKGPQAVAVSTSKSGKLKTSGGKRNPAAEEAIATARSRQLAKRSGVQALSNADLQKAVNRMNLERQFKNLNSSGPVSKFVNDLLKSQGKQKLNSVVDDTAKQVGEALKKK